MRFASGMLMAVAATVLSLPANAAVTLASLPYTQDFDTIARTGSSSVLPAGWEIAESGSIANSLYLASAGAGTAGNTYSFGAAGSTERALGGIATPALLPRFGVQFTNGLSGQTITELDISYFGELWRAGAAANLNTLGFSYSLDATSLTTGTYTNFSDLDFAITPGGANNQARNGNIDRTEINAVITGLYIAPGESIYLRWSGTNAPNNDHGLAIDDFRLSATTVPEPASWALLIAGFGLVGAVQRRRRIAAA